MSYRVLVDRTSHSRDRSPPVRAGRTSRRTRRRSRCAGDRRPLPRHEPRARHAGQRPLLPLHDVRPRTVPGERRDEAEAQPGFSAWDYARQRCIELCEAPPRSLPSRSGSARRAPRIARPRRAVPASIASILARTPRKVGEPGMRIVFDPTSITAAGPGRFEAAGRRRARTGWGRQSARSPGDGARPSAARRSRRRSVPLGWYLPSAGWQGSGRRRPRSIRSRRRGRLLQWRDTLVMGRWTGTARGPRLAALAVPAGDGRAGLPDRLRAVQEALQRRAPAVRADRAAHPRADLEWLWQRTFRAARAARHPRHRGRYRAAPAPDGSDLAVARAGRFKPNGDGTLLLLRPAGPLCGGRRGGRVDRLASARGRHAHCRERPRPRHGFAPPRPAHCRRLARDARRRAAPGAALVARTWLVAPGSASGRTSCSRCAPAPCLPRSAGAFGRH